MDAAIRQSKKWIERDAIELDTAIKKTDGSVRFGLGFGYERSGNDPMCRAAELLQHLGDTRWIENFKCAFPGPLFNSGGPPILDIRTCDLVGGASKQNSRPRDRFNKAVEEASARDSEAGTLDNN